MPLRDHFGPPLDKIASWEELHGQWPAVIVQQLRKQLPPGYVAVSIIDLVTVRHFNLYVELLTMIGHVDPTLGDPPPHLCAASCRWVRREKRTILEAWSHELNLGEPLPGGI